MSEGDVTQQRIMQRLSATRQSVVPLDQLQGELQLDPKAMAAALRGLLQDGRVALRRGGKGEESRMFLSLAGDLSEHAEMVLSAIRASGTSGIDQAQLVSRVRIPKSEVLKILNALIEDRHIKERRSFSNRTKRIYLLFNVEPSAHVTGGSFYCGEELDVAYIDELRRRLVAYVAEQKVVTMPQIKTFLDDQHIAAGASTTLPSTGPHTAGTKSHRPSDNASESFYDLSSPIHFVNEHTPQQSQLVFPPTRSPSGSPSSLGTAVAQQLDEAGGERLRPQLPARTLSARDVQILTHSLILDGVLEEVAPGAVTELSAARMTLGAQDDVYDVSALGDEAFAGPTGRRTTHASTASASSTAAGLTCDDRAHRHYQLAPAGANVVRHFSATPKRARDGTWLRRSASSSSESHHQSLLHLGQHSADMEAARRRQTPRVPAPPQARHAQLLELLKEEGLFIPSSLSEQTIAAPGGGGYMPAVGFPCLGCPQLAQCSNLQSSLFNVHRCAYMKEWLGE